MRRGGEENPLEQYVWDIRYVDAPVVRFYDGDTDGNYLDASDNVLYYVEDANFSVTALVDAASGAVVERYVYDAYGKVSVFTGARDDQGNSTTEWQPRSVMLFDNQILYCGYRKDPVTGLYHTDTREYDAYLGRWLGRDSGGYIDGMNLYQYVSGNPATLVDPSGLCGGTAPEPDGLPWDSSFSPDADWGDRTVASGAMGSAGPAETAGEDGTAEVPFPGNASGEESRFDRQRRLAEQGEAVAEAMRQAAELLAANVAQFFTLGCSDSVNTWRDNAWRSSPAGGTWVETASTTVARVSCITGTLAVALAGYPVVVSAAEPYVAAMSAQAAELWTATTSFVTAAGPRLREVAQQVWNSPVAQRLANQFGQAARSVVNTAREVRDLVPAASDAVNRFMSEHPDTFQGLQSFGTGFSNAVAKKPDAAPLGNVYEGYGRAVGKLVEPVWSYIWPKVEERDAQNTQRRGESQ